MEIFHFRHTSFVKKYYSESGQLMYQLIVSKNKIYSTKMWWYANGHKEQEEHYKNGIRNGLSYAWYDNGNKQFEGSYLNDMKNGFWIFYFKNGKIAQKGNCIEGMQDSLHYQSEVDGSYNYTNFKVGLKHGEWKFYNSDNTLDQIDIYKDGQFIESKKSPPSKVILNKKLKK